MYDLKTKTMIEEADGYMNAAHNELYKPEEDVVHYMVCQYSIKAVHGYLTGYLLNHGMDLIPNVPIKALLEKCQRTDPKFNNLDLSHLFDAHENEDLWVNPGIAEKFMEMAQQTKAMVVPADSPSSQS